MADSRHTRLQADVAVIGGGVIGLGIAHEARRLGRSVALIDPAPASGASFAAAGMLAPVSELHYQEEDLLELMLESSQLWPSFVDGLHQGAEDNGYRTTPTLAVGADAADRRALADLRSVQLAAGLEVEPIALRDARQREPLLSPQISCAFDIPADHQVDPRKLAACLLAGLAAIRPMTVPGCREPMTDSPLLPGRAVCCGKAGVSQAWRWTQESPFTPEKRWWPTGSGRPNSPVFLKASGFP